MVATETVKVLATTAQPFWTALGYLHYLPAASRLRELLHTDGEWYVRASAAEALARIHDESSLSDIEQAMTDPDPQVQRAVILALGQFLVQAATNTFQLLFEEWTLQE